MTADRLPSVRLLDIVLLSTAVFASAPAAFTLEMRIGGIPVLNGFFLATALAVCFYYARDFRGSRRIVAVYSVAGMVITGVTLLYWDRPVFDSRAALQDVFCYTALPVGLALGQIKGRLRFKELLSRCYFAVCITFAISLLLLMGGYIESTGGEGRELDRAMFTSSFIISMTFPCMWAIGRGKRPSFRILVLAGLGLAILFAVISATRSSFITILISLVSTVIVEVKRDFKKIFWMGAAAIVFLGAAVNGSIPGLQTFGNTRLAERLGATDYENEDRFEELTMMLDQMGTAEWIHGVGFGVGFESPIPESGVATVPHIGISALLYKGGAAAVVILLLTPCLVGVWGLIMFRPSDRDPFLGGVAIYFVQSCFSGGWAFIPLLFLGAFLFLGLDRNEENGASRPIILMRVTENAQLSQPVAG